MKTARDEAYSFIVAGGLIGAKLLAAKAALAASPKVVAAVGGAKTVGKVGAAYLAWRAAKSTARGIYGAIHNTSGATNQIKTLPRWRAAWLTNVNVRLNKAIAKYKETKDPKDYKRVEKLRRIQRKLE